MKMVEKIFFVLIIFYIFGCYGAFNNLNYEGYKIGQDIKIQCINSQGEWGPGPICQEKNTEIVFKYGIDEFVNCGWNIHDKESYNFFKELITRKENWACRVEKAPKLNFYIPLYIPVWGVVETNHIHVDTHMNFVFHASQGDVLAATAYPVQDYFQQVEPGTIIKMHGPVKWFKGHYFTDFNYLSPFKIVKGDVESIVITILWVFISTIATVILAVLCYKYNLKPNLIKKYIKVD